MNGGSQRKQGTPLPPPFFCKYMKLNSFKSFVLKVYDSKGVADAFLRKYVILNDFKWLC